jgi:hypothetical protein
MAVLLTVAASHQFCPKFSFVRLATLDLSSQCGRFHLAFAEIVVHRVLVTKIVSNHGVNIGQPERWERVDNAFGVGPLLIFIDKYVQRDAGVSDPEGAAFVGP